MRRQFAGIDFARAFGHEIFNSYRLNYACARVVMKRHIRAMRQDLEASVNLEVIFRLESRKNVEITLEHLREQQIRNGKIFLAQR